MAKHTVCRRRVLINYTPASKETWVVYTISDRAPLLFIGGSEDHITPSAVNKANAKHHAKLTALTEYFEFDSRDHWTTGVPGWEAVADKALEWALAHVSSPHLRINAQQPIRCRGPGREVGSAVRRPATSLPSDTTMLSLRVRADKLDSLMAIERRGY